MKMSILKYQEALHKQINAIVITVRGGGGAIHNAAGNVMIPINIIEKSQHHKNFR